MVLPFFSNILFALTFENHIFASVKKTAKANNLYINLIINIFITDVLL